MAIVAVAAVVSYGYSWLQRAEENEEMGISTVEVASDTDTLVDMDAKSIPELILILERCQGSLLVEAAVIRLGDLAAFSKKISIKAVDLMFYYVAALQREIAKCGGITLLLERLSDMDCTQRCATVILTTLANLAVNDNNHHEIGNEDNLEMYRAWYIEGDIETKRACARLLKNLAMWECHAAELLAIDVLSPLAKDLFQLNDSTLDETILQCWLNMIEPCTELHFLQKMLSAIENGDPLSERSKETTNRILFLCTKREEAAHIFGEQIVHVLNSLEYFLETTESKPVPGHDELWKWYLDQTTLEKPWET
ncbi:hypothetical protein THRCLA_03371 [Thraustotheca clavata]|uniref:Uncharacterized protein n=1 Tax=Thraustotheca clavata TaxID=74557 RepID=A0A1W0A272_9STRA|nr:hypothetical protein THRCLA_03371 [Thraustotheca clavata]